jgi:hypothetical protein
MGAYVSRPGAKKNFTGIQKHFFHNSTIFAKKVNLGNMLKHFNVFLAALPQWIFSLSWTIPNFISDHDT